MDLDDYELACAQAFAYLADTYGLRVSEWDLIL